MKILFVFIDMFRPNMLRMVDESRKKQGIESFFVSHGGHFYTRCYTPAPDTPRSSGCLWSGKYPNENGCNTRIKYPLYYLNEPKDTFLRQLKDNGFELNFVMNKTNAELGELPEEFEEENYYYGIELEKTLPKVEIHDQSFTYISIQDYHHMVSDWNSRPQAIEQANRISLYALETIDKYLNMEQFDLTVVYSDHGWMVNNEMKCLIDQMGDNRTQILLYIKKKNEKQLVLDDRLCSILDLGISVLDYCGISTSSSEADKKSLFSNNYVRDKILIEDHKSFRVEIGQAIELWGVRTDDYLFCVDAYGREEYSANISEQEKEECRQYILLYGSSYEENRKCASILKKYNNLSEVHIYQNGEKRRSHPGIMQVIKGVIRKLTDMR